MAKVMKKGSAPKPAAKTHGSGFTYAPYAKTSPGDVSNKKKK